MPDIPLRFQRKKQVAKEKKEKKNEFRKIFDSFFVVCLWLFLVLATTSMRNSRAASLTNESTLRELTQSPSTTHEGWSKKALRTQDHFYDVRNNLNQSGLLVPK